MSARRRGRGEGSIAQRSDGRWWARADLGWINGKRQRKAVYGKTRAEVAAKLGNVLRDVQQGIPLASERQTVAQYLGYWLDEIARTRVRPLTLRSYEERVRLHILPGLGRVALARLTPQRVQTWINDRIASGASPQSCRYNRAVLRAALTHAVRWGMLPRNPAALVDLPRASKTEIRPFSPEQARAFLAAAAGNRIEALFTVALAVGLRQGEALGLAWKDVSVDDGTLQVRRTLHRIGGDRVRLRALRAERKELTVRWRNSTDAEERARFAQERARLWKEIQGVRRHFSLGEPKSARSRRTINLPAFVVKALRAHRARQLEERLIAGGDWQDSGLVFTTRRGTPLDPRAATKVFHAIRSAATLPPIRFHDLRHTAATLLLAQGVSPRVIMETLGHSQISLTLDTYSHILPALQQEAADRMDAVLGS